MTNFLPVFQDDDGNLLYEDGIEPIVVRTSERTKYKDCRRQFIYTSHLWHNLEPVVMNHNLAFGIATHVGMENYYDPDRWSEVSDKEKTEFAIAAFVAENERQRKQEEDSSHWQMSAERMQEYKEREELGTSMLEQYGLWAPPQDAKLGLKPLKVEWKFQVPVYTKDGSPLVVGERPVVYQLRVDMLAEHEGGSIWIWDHKTTKSTATGDTRFLDLDTQLSSYLWAYLVKFGKKPAGMVYNELAKIKVAPPKLIKNGMAISVDKRQNTTYDMYMQAIEENGFDPAEYSDMLEHLASTTKDKYFYRNDVRRNKVELAIQGEYVVQEVREMASRDLPVYPNPGKITCNGCDFKLPCTIANEGGDVDFALGDETMYRQRPTERVGEF